MKIKNPTEALTMVPSAKDLDPGWKTPKNQKTLSIKKLQTVT